MNGDGTRIRAKNALWLLPLIALGVAVFAASRRAPGTASAATKRRVYQFAEGCARQRVGQDFFGRDPRKTGITLHFPPFQDSFVTALGDGRFVCSSYLDFERPARPALRDPWVCTVAQAQDQTQNPYRCEHFQAQTLGLPP